MSTQYQDVSWQHKDIYSEYHSTMSSMNYSARCFTTMEDSKERLQKALTDYSNAMRLGNTKTLPELFSSILN